jgi:hypothetical protein
MENPLDNLPGKHQAESLHVAKFYVAGKVSIGFEVENGGGAINMVLSPGIGYAQKDGI